MEEPSTYSLSKKAIVGITISYASVIIVAVVVLCWVMAVSVEICSNSILLYTAISSSAVAAMLCCVQYLKRLYKACIDNRIVITDNSLKQFGYILYFSLRPIYAIVFALVVDIAMLAGVIVVTVDDFEVNNRFMYLCIVVSSIIGFSIGRVLDVFELIGKSKIAEITKNIMEKIDE